MEPQMKISSDPQISTFHQVLKSPTMGTVTALALAILSAVVAVRYGDFRSFSAVLIGAATGFVVKLIHDTFFILPEPGMAPDALKKKLSNDLYSLYARIGIHGVFATEIVEGKLNLIFNKITQRIAELDEAYEKRSSTGLILPNGNFNALTICLYLQSHKEKIKIGKGSFYNILSINVESLKLSVEGIAVKAKLRDSESIN